MRSSRSTYDAKRKGKEVYEENNDGMHFADFIAQRGNKGIIICENNMNSRSEEMAKFMGTSNDDSGGQNLQFQNMSEVSPDYFGSNSVEEMSVGPRLHNPRIMVHPSKIISPSIPNQNYNQNMQRISVSAPNNFSLLKLLMEEENISTLTDEKLLYAKELLSTDQGLSLEEQRMQQSPYTQVGNKQNMQTTSESTTSNFSYMKLLMEVEESFKLTNVLYEKQLLSTQYNLSLEGQMVQQWPCRGVGNYQFENSSGGQMVQQWLDNQVGNYQFENSSSGQMVQQWPDNQVGNYQFENSSDGQMVQQLLDSQVENYQFENTSEGHMMQQWPCSEVGNYQFENSSGGQMVQQWTYSEVENYQFENSSGGQIVQQWPSRQFENSLQQINLENCQNQELQQTQQTSYMDLSFMDLLTREDISYVELLTSEDISWTLDV